MSESSNRVGGFVAGTCLAAAWAYWSLGCGGSVGTESLNNADGGESTVMTAFADADTPNVSDGGPAGSACVDYYAALYTRCGGPVLPASEQARQQARFVQVCLNDIALPGSGMTLPAVEACVSALDVSACELPDGPPVACNFAGSLSGGAACNEGLQCQSGICLGTAAFSPDGPIGPYTCGTCAPFVENGQVCAHENFSGGCGSQGSCLLEAGTGSSMDPTYTCVTIDEGGPGANCDELSTLCQPGLYCAARTGQCQELGDTGAPCGEGASPPGNPGGCQAPLSCVGDPGMATCALGGSGAFCLDDYDCASGLGCVPGPCAGSGVVARIGCSASGTCQPVNWVSPGQTCDGYATRCLVGSCGGSSFVPLVQPADGGPAMGICPTIVADGQPCNSACDVSAECFSPTGKAGMSGLTGTCTLLDSVVCE